MIPFSSLLGPSDAITRGGDFLRAWKLVMRGAYRHQEGARLTSLVLDPATGTATQSTMSEREGEFPIVAVFDIGQRYQHERRHRF